MKILINLVNFLGIYKFKLTMNLTAIYYKRKREKKKSNNFLNSIYLGIKYKGFLT